MLSTSGYSHHPYYTHHTTDSGQYFHSSRHHQEFARHRNLPGRTQLISTPILLHSFWKQPCNQSRFKVEIPLEVLQKMCSRIHIYSLLGLTPWSHLTILQCIVVDRHWVNVTVCVTAIVNSNALIRVNKQNDNLNNISHCLVIGLAGLAGSCGIHGKNFVVIILNMYNGYTTMVGKSYI